jgi:rubredoxin
MIVTTGLQADPRTRLWVCEACGLVYNPIEGDPDGGVSPGTPFEQIPDDWFCPVCAVDKSFFRAVRPGEVVGEGPRLSS